MGAEPNFDWTASTTSLLDWWREAGVDVAIAEEPRNWLSQMPKPSGDIVAESEIPPAADPRKPVPEQVRIAPPTPAPTRVIAPMPRTIAAFDAWRQGSDAPDSGWIGTRIGAEGSPESRLMVVIEMPERDDGSIGTLLSGAVGTMFDRMLAAIGHHRGSIYLVPMCIVRPNTGSIPPDALPHLAAALRHQTALVAPKRVLVFGNAASRALLGAEIAEMRGALRPVNRNKGEDGMPIEAVASYHPRFLLERPAAKAEAWKDLLLLAQEIDS